MPTLHAHYGKSSGIQKLNRKAMLLLLFADDAASYITTTVNVLKQGANHGTLVRSWRKAFCPSCRTFDRMGSDGASRYSALMLAS
jgi:hypothetical protein